MKISNILAFKSDELFGTDFVIHYANGAWQKDRDEIILLEKCGLGTANMYWYRDDISIVYLYSLSVEQEARCKGLGTRLQKIREKIGIYLGATTAMLWVEKDTWMIDWYKRRGYIEFDNINEPDKNLIWMRKDLTKIHRNYKQKIHRKPNLKPL